MYSTVVLRTIQEDNVWVKPISPYVKPAPGGGPSPRIVIADAHDVVRQGVRHTWKRKY